MEIVPLLTECNPLWPVLPAVVCHNDPVASKTKITRKLGKAALEISDNLPSVLFIVQRIQQELNTAVFLFMQNRMNQKKRYIHLPVMKQHGFEHPGWAVDRWRAIYWGYRRLQLPRTYNDRSKAYLEGFKSLKLLLTLSLSCDLQKFHCLNFDVKTQVLEIVCKKSLIRSSWLSYYGFLSSASTTTSFYELMFYSEDGFSILEGVGTASSS